MFVRSYTVLNTTEVLFIINLYFFCLTSSKLLIISSQIPGSLTLYSAFSNSLLAYSVKSPGSYTSHTKLAMRIYVIVT